MDHYATQMGQISILGLSQDEPRLQPQPQRAELVPFDMYAHPSQYAPLVPAPTAYGMATTVFSASMAQCGQPSPMPHMMGPADVPPPFASSFTQPPMIPGLPYGRSIPPPSTIYFPQPQMVPGSSYGHYIPPYQSYGGYTPGPHAMGVAPSYYPSAPSTVKCLDGQHLDHGPLQKARVAKRKAVDSDYAGRETRTKRLRIDYDIPPELQPVLVDGEIRYKCLLLQCQDKRAMKRGSVPRHIGSNTHKGQAGLFLCSYCSKDLSRSDSLKRHFKSCPKTNTFAYVPQEPDAIAPATFVPQPPMLQGPFTFQPVWASPALASVTPASDESLGDSINNLELDATPVCLDDTNDSPSGKLFEIDVDAFNWDSGYETDDSTSGKSLEDLLNDLDWTKVPGHLP
ncbi:hypothetical protein DEU56DRAFT_180723 [Suillus clintonianus]|uniref:uncharacterized protein n=1 Tax=Suillus clintonianus TaxID=1904413 RepID=UPI001B85B4BB|nr:uncharacterized protein DEU56DRAFT_180723 [Suillus clintonianus]KAG2145757.1 hypothetical protein DEU56DRAFT_180723 [Suillus clintonianus]